MSGFVDDEAEEDVASAAAPAPARAARRGRQGPVVIDRPVPAVGDYGDVTESRTRAMVFTCHVNQELEG